MTALDQRDLAELDPVGAVPAYQRTAVTAGIVHLGVGNFHRAHQAMYLDALMNAGKAMDWGIHGVGVQPSNSTMRDALAAQDISTPWCCATTTPRGTHASSDPSSDIPSRQTTRKP